MDCQAIRWQWANLGAVASEVWVGGARCTSAIWPAIDAQLANRRGASRRLRGHEINQMPTPPRAASNVAAHRRAMGTRESRPCAAAWRRAWGCKCKLACHCWLVQQCEVGTRRPLLDEPAVALLSRMSFASQLLGAGDHLGELAAVAMGIFVARGALGNLEHARKRRIPLVRRAAE
jgi:hypothetical protein